MGVADDAPALDMAYKLTGYAGKGRLKLSPGKRTLPGRKQVFRQEDDEGRLVRDVIGRADEILPGRPLLRKVMEGGLRLPAGGDPLEALRHRTRRELERLPEGIRALEAADPPWTVIVSDELRSYTENVTRAVAERTTGQEDEEDT